MAATARAVDDGRLAGSEIELVEDVMRGRGGDRERRGEFPGEAGWPPGEPVDGRQRLLGVREKTALNEQRQAGTVVRGETPSARAGL